MGMAAEGQGDVGVGQHLRPPVAGVVREEDAEAVGARQGLRQVATVDGAEALTLAYGVVHAHEGQPLTVALNDRIFVA